MSDELTTEQHEQLAQIFLHYARPGAESERIFARAIAAAERDGFEAGKQAVINYLESEDFNISRKDYNAMKALKPE